MIPEEECDAELYKIYRWHKKLMSEGKDNASNRLIKVEIIEPEFIAPSMHTKILIEKENSKAYVTCTIIPTRGGTTTQFIKDK